MTEDTSPENLRKFLESDDPALVMMGISMAKGMDVEITIKDFERFLKSEHFKTIEMGFTFAEEAGIGAEAVEMLCEALGKGNKAVIWALGDIGDVRAVEPLIKALGDKDKDVRQRAIDALRKISDKRAVEPLIGVLSDDEWRVRHDAAIALGNIGDKRAVEPLIKDLKDKDYTFRTYVTRALGNIGDKRAVEPLIGVLSDDEWRVCDAATEALGEIGDERAVEPLIEVLSDGVCWEHVRKSAAGALGKIGDERAVEPLIKALEDKSSDVRKAAKEALRELGHEVE